MLRGILVGLDGSPYSDAAVELSLRWASGSGAELFGLGIVDEPTIRKPTGLMIGSGHYKPLADELNLVEARRRVDEALEEFARRCSAAGIPYHRLREVGVSSEQILLESQRCDLIVLGKQSYFQVEAREGPDETLQTVLHNTPRPVVTVPRLLPPPGSPVVVAGYDASVQAARALHALLHSGLLATHQVCIVSAHEEIETAAGWARMAADFLALHGITATTKPVGTTREPAAVLLEAAAELGAGLLAMGAYGQRTIKEFFFGSATKAALRRATIPLFLFH
ncbi:MAG: universal stress protein [Pirellulaceae bacterium]|nr:universal stress protein [Pirellulaceae bacterium]